MLPNELSASEAARQIAAGRLTSEDLVRACLDRIAARDADLQAWVCTKAEAALNEARQKDKQASSGPLHGVPVGVKDVIETIDLPTEMNSPIYKGYQSRGDAACVAALRAAGAIVLGKTVTAEFAYIAPGPTRNPHNPRHTPGGSSSGSAAAVADFMVPIALGTQTGGSIIRPASFCGVMGYKPTYAMVSRSGLKLAAESLDTIGLLARSVEDAALFKSIFAGPVSDGSNLGKITPPKIGLCRTHLWPKADAAARVAVEAAAKALSQAGAQITEFEAPAFFTDLDAARPIINNVERAQSGAWEWHNHRPQLSKQMVECIEKGLVISPADYLDAVRLCERSRVEMDAAFQGIDALLTLAASGEAPEGLASTGDATFQSLWTMLHVPTITLPTHKGPKGLPVGIQLVGRRYHDNHLFHVAQWAWQRFA